MFIWNNTSLLSITYTFENKFQGNFNQDVKIVIQEDVFENVVWKMSATCSGLSVLILRPWNYEVKLTLFHTSV